VLDKAAAYAAARKIDPAVLLQTRLFPDMFPLTRQVQIAAGSMVVLGVILGVTVSPLFYALSGFVGAGLVFAGVTGTCGLASVLRLMPWNRPSPSGTQAA
jgi:hypothetical protein